METLTNFVYLPIMTNRILGVEGQRNRCSLSHRASSGPIAPVINMVTLQGLCLRILHPRSFWVLLTN